jgi:hypothetical protein
MNQNDMTLIEGHLGENSELKALWNEHLKFEQQLEKIERKPYLTPEEKVEKKRLQLAKLAGKTRIEEILVEYRSEAG